MNPYESPKKILCIIFCFSLPSIVTIHAAAVHLNSKRHDQTSYPSWPIWSPKSGTDIYIYIYSICMYIYTYIIHRYMNQWKIYQPWFFKVTFSAMNSRSLNPKQGHLATSNGSLWRTWRIYDVKFGHPPWIWWSGCCQKWSWSALVTMASVSIGSVVSHHPHPCNYLFLLQRHAYI